MTDVNIDSLIREISGTMPTVETSEEGTATIGQKTTDTIETSQQDAKKTVVELAIPWLMQAYTGSTGGVNPEKLAALVANIEQQVADIKNQILDKWSENIQEIKEADKEAVKEKIRLGLDQFENAINTHASQASKSSGSGVVIPLAAMTTMMVFGALAASGGIGLAGVNEAGTEAVKQLNSIIQEMGLVPPEINPNFLLIATLFTLIPTYFSQLTTVGSAEGAKGRQIDLKFAERYANNIAAMISNPDMKEGIKSMMSAAGIPEGKQERLVAMIQLSYLLSALALYQKAELGYISDIDIGQLLKDGGKGLDEGDPRLALLQQFQILRGSIPEKDLANYLQGALAYFYGDPDMDKLLEVPTLLKRMKEEEDYEINKIIENRD